MYYKQSVVIDRPIGNNVFIYDERRQLFGKAEIFVPVMIHRTLDDVQLGDAVVFAEKVDGEVREFVGLRNLVHLVIARKEQGD